LAEFEKDFEGFLRFKRKIKKVLNGLRHR
jgi:hypothetical protein